MNLCEQSIEFFQKKNFGNLEKLIYNSCRYDRQEIMNTLFVNFGIDEVKQNIIDSFASIGLVKSLMRA